MQLITQFCCVDPDGTEIVVNYVDENGKKQKIHLNQLSDINRLKDVKSKGDFVAGVFKSLGYLKGEKTLKTALTSKSSVDLIYKSNSPANLSQSGDVIKFDPKVGIALVNNDQVGKPVDQQEENGDVQSPALGLLHEFDHFVEFAKDNGKTISDNQSIEDAIYGNKEEKRVVTGTETQAAGRLGEPTRTNHSGVPVITQGPTSQVKVDDIPQVKFMKMQRQAIQNATKQDSSKRN